jgi:hypothetical protein
VRAWTVQMEVVDKLAESGVHRIYVVNRGACPCPHSCLLAC